jgi:hypothetical protein
LKELSSQEDNAGRDIASRVGPNFLGRTAPLERDANFSQYNNKTNRHNSHDVLLPAADSRNSRHCSHHHLTDMTKGEIIYMIGKNMISKALTGEEFSSYSKDMLFLVVHALRHHYGKQANVTIQPLDRVQPKALTASQPDSTAHLTSTLPLMCLSGLVGLMPINQTPSAEIYGVSLTWPNPKPQPQPRTGAHRRPDQRWPLQDLSRIPRTR